MNGRQRRERVEKNEGEGDKIGRSRVLVMRLG